MTTSHSIRLFTGVHADTLYSVNPREIVATVQCTFEADNNIAVTLDGDCRRSMADTDTNEGNTG